MSELMILTSETDIKKIVEEVVRELRKQEEPKEEKKEEKLYTANEACVFLRCSKPTLHRWKRDGLVPHVKIGTNIRYRESDLKKIIDK